MRQGLVWTKYIQLLNKFILFRSNPDQYQVATEYIVVDESDHKLPNLIHFIWTRNPIKEKYVNNILAFSKNVDYRIYVWTDQNWNSSLFNYTSNIYIKNVTSLTLINKDNIDVEGVGAASDILRLEVKHNAFGMKINKRFFSDCIPIWRHLHWYWF